MANKSQTKTKTTKKTGKPEKKKKNTTRSESGNAKRKKSLGVRVIHGRIYDSQNGKSCHQCRQKTLDFGVSCKNQSVNKQCTIHFCHICLLNRYGEKAEEMAELGDWKCPKCRGICNCSLCMKKRGCCPTGRLVQAAKATGFSSVSEMLRLKNPEEFQEDSSESLKKETTSKEEERVASTGKRKKENVFEGKSYSKSKHKTNGGDEKNENPQAKRLRKNDGSKVTKKITKDAGVSPENLTNSKKVLKKNHKKPNKLEDNEAKMTNTGGAKYKKVNGFHKCQKKTAEVQQDKVSDVEILLPQGTELTNVANVDLPAEDIGHALQFLEFCEAFAKALDIKKGQPECLLREIACGQSSRRSQGSPIVQFHIKLLSVIQNYSGKRFSSLKTEGRNSWLQALSRCISESEYQSKELLLDCSSLVDDGYGELSSFKKLRLLNFLCDEALGTAELRGCIDEQNVEFVEEEKKAKEKVLAEREKEKDRKMKLRDEMVRTILMKNGAPLSASEYRDLELKMKAEAARNLVEILEAEDIMMKKKQRSDAVRSEPLFLDGNGRKFWKLRGYSGERDVLIQDVRNGDLVTFKERWFSCNVDESVNVEKYISRLHAV
ncbi:Cell division cycle-associated 7-like protein [Actinidia chinensis var. chinensis]|uniref:Cell division cycle-associated 7-like protein n=1 Tax=Actinidia chinensis var. chinensis TaxID=1590841 RepID=A0A2R6PU73_ACTCC|nr:Cell division cycle-associated 7-like protein [Actinidia chinensis var. chinensis]